MALYSIKTIDKTSLYTYLYIYKNPLLVNNEKRNQQECLRPRELNNLKSHIYLSLNVSPLIFGGSQTALYILKIIFVPQ